MNTPIKTVNRQTLVTISPKVHQVIENKLTRNFTAMPYVSSRFNQTVEWLRKYYWELNNIAGTSNFSWCPRLPNGSYIWECNNNMGNLILQIIHTTSNPIVVVIDEDLSSKFAPFALVENKIYKKNRSITIRFTENKQYNTNSTMKQTIRLTESELRGMIHKAVREVLSKQPNKRRGINEANTSRYPRYRGVPGTKFIYGGSMSDSTIVYKRRKIDAYDVEDYLWNAYEDYGYEEAGQEEPTNEGFEEWVKNVDEYWIQGILEDLMWAQY